MENKDPWEKRPEYYAAPVALMSAGPANFDHADGEPAAVVTIARKDIIEPLVFNMADTRKLATALLVTLATYDDEFAKKLLDNNFPAGDDGNFEWPKEDGWR
jgi:hypothetical protein